MNYLDTLSLWLGYVVLTLAAVRTVIAALMVTRASLLELKQQLTTRATDSLALAACLKPRPPSFYIEKLHATERAQGSHAEAGKATASDLPR